MPAACRHSLHAVNYCRVSITLATMHVNGAPDHMEVAYSLPDMRYVGDAGIYDEDDY